MFFYYVVIVMLFCMEMFLMSKVREFSGKSRLCAFVIFFQFFLLFGFRDPTVLPDTDSYYSSFSKISGKYSFYEYDPYGRFERGYMALCYLVRNDLGLSFMWFEALVAALFLGGTIFFLYRYSTYTWMAMFLMVITLYMIDGLIAMRQCLAIVVGLFFFPLLQRQRYIAYGLVVLVAIFFHSSAIGLFILIPLMWNGMGYKTKLWLVMGGGIIVFLGYSIVFEFLDTLDYYGGESYTGTSLDKNGLTLIGLFDFIRTFGIVAYILYLRKLLKGKNVYDDRRLEETLILVCILDLVVSLFAIRFWIMVRFKLYFDPFIFAYSATLYPVLRRSNRAKYATWTLFLFVTASSIFLFYYRPEWAHFLPYKLYDK